MDKLTAQAADQGNRYPIRTVSQLTGVNAVTLRAWERRYGLIRPKRTDSGHRVYSADHVELIRQILKLLDEGMSIGQVGTILLARQEQHGVGTGGPWSEYRTRLLERVEAFDDFGLDEVYNEAISIYPVDMVSARLIVPIVRQLGTRWQERIGSVAEEHFFRTFLRNKLGARLHNPARRARGPRIVLACLPKEQHEIGLLLFALSAVDHGFRLVLLGADLPLEDIPNVCQRTNCSAVVLAGSERPTSYPIADALASVIGQIQLPVYVGGRVSLLCHEEIETSGANVLGEDVGTALRKMANELAPGPTA